MEAEAARGRGGKLIRGVRLALIHPEWNRPCAACETWWYEDDGRVKRDATGEPMRRPAGAPTPCNSCAKVPKWAKERGFDVSELRKLADEITPENEQAWEAYREFRATGAFPDDPVVRWYSALCREVEDEAAKVPAERLAAATDRLFNLLMMRGLGRR